MAKKSVIKDILSWVLMMIKIWYYKPWAYHPKINPQYVFDANGKNVLEKDETKEKHPLDRIVKVKIKSSMVEVPND